MSLIKHIDQYYGVPINEDRALFSSVDYTIFGLSVKE